jgi:hypothetical protein
MSDITEPAMGMLNMGAATVKGAVQGFTGLPGDVEALAYGIKELFNRGAGEGKIDAFLRGMSEQTIMPRTDEIRKWLDANVGTVAGGQNPYETIGEVVAPAGQIKAAKAAVKGVAKGAKALAPKAGEMLDAYVQRTGMQANLMAYHGTPHSFNKFDAAKIGSGEGHQAYGYGLYFAENPEVAQSYRWSTGLHSAPYVDGKAFDPTVLLNPGFKAKTPEEYAALAGSLSLDPKSLLQQAVSGKKGFFDAQKYFPDKKIAAQAAELSITKGKNPFQTQGPLFTVDISDEMVAKMLDFDAPISSQSQEIQALAKRYNIQPEDLGGDLLAAAEGKTAAGAQRLRDAGIPGVRYLDQGSRGQREGTRNIVVFPGGEDQVKILKREDSGK